MREFALSFAVLPSVLGQLPVKSDEVESWWEKANKHGVGFVFFVLFLALMYISYRRETKAEEARTKREELANAERLALQTEIRDLNQRQLDQSDRHANALKRVILDGNKAQADVGVELKNLARKVNCPRAIVPSSQQ